MMTWVKQAYARTRGPELPGNYNPALLAELFREQSKARHSIASAHVHEILEIVSHWVKQASRKLMQEEGLRRKFEVILQEWLFKAEELAQGELGKLIEDEKRSPLTYNHYYTDNVQKARLDTQKPSVHRAVSTVAENDWNGKLHISNHTGDVERFISALQARITVDMDEQACNEALIELNAYYKVAMKTFVDNVARQVIERHIIWPLPSAFCPNSVSQLSEDELLSIGSEPEQQSFRRSRLADVARGLRKSLIDLQRLPS